MSLDLAFNTYSSTPKAGRGAGMLRENPSEELHELEKSVEHIKKVVATQQSHAGATRVVELVCLSDSVDDALRMNGGSSALQKIDVVKQRSELPLLRLDRHRLLQILVNLNSNAKQAMGEMSDRHPCITLDASLIDGAGAADGCMLRIPVTDNGGGIAPENLVRVFSHGFTTRKGGHGFGLHSCAVAATEMGGRISAHSEGVGCGARFTLEIPIGTTAV